MILTAWGTWAQSPTPETGVAEGEQVQKMQADVPDEKRIFFPSHFFVRDRRQELPQPLLAAHCHLQASRRRPHG